MILVVFSHVYNYLFCFIKLALPELIKILNIKKSEFTFGKSLNIGCAAAKGKYLVFVSGHCVPASESWLEKLVQPLESGLVDYAYGRQVGRDTTKFSEEQVFKKYFPRTSRVPQQGIFCNNANAAITVEKWAQYKFDECLTGLEDMMLAKKIVEDGGKIGYVSDSTVFHIHDEPWGQVRTRYEREALALKEILPEVHLSLFDCFRYFISGAFHDLVVSTKSYGYPRNLGEIIRFRLMQYWGAYRGNKAHREVSAKRREEYFYPLHSGEKIDR